MGSIGNQNPWTPYYDNYKDCSLGICSIYCPQFCYFLFPPPPPSDDSSAAPFSPLIIAIIGVLGGAFLLISYYTIVTRYCSRGNQSRNAVTEEDHDEVMNHDHSQVVASTGLDEAMIKTITVCKYKKGDGLIEGTECAVCLSEFQENECLRVLPKCSHAFHLPCIDTWLKSHSNCPLCRANVVVLAQPSPPPLPFSQPLLALSVDSHENRRPDELVLVVVDDDDDDEATTSSKSRIQENGNAGEVERRIKNGEIDEEGVGKFRRSVSLGAFSSQDLEVERDDSWREIGSSKGFGEGERKLSGDGLVRNLAMKRCNSTGRFVFIDHDKGKNSILPN